MLNCDCGSSATREDPPPLNLHCSRIERPMEMGRCKHFPALRLARRQALARVAEYNRLQRPSMARSAACPHPRCRPSPHSSPCRLPRAGCRRSPGRNWRVPPPESRRAAEPSDRHQSGAGSGFRVRPHEPPGYRSGEASTFKIFDDHVEQTITHFAMDDEPVAVGLVFDISGSMGPKLQQSRQAAAAVFQDGQSRRRVLSGGVQRSAAAGHAAHRRTSRRSRISSPSRSPRAAPRCSTPSCWRCTR